MTDIIFGELIVDRAKGTIWFNSSEYGMCVLRVQNIPKEKMKKDQMIDLRIE